MFELLKSNPIGFILSNLQTILMAAISCAAVAFFLLWRNEVKEHENFRIAVVSAGQIQEEKTKSIANSQKSITNQSEATYAQTNSALTELYGPGRVQSNSGSSKLPAVSKTAGKPNATTSDPRPSATVSQADQDYQCQGLKSDAARTTQQLLFLQDWVDRQSNVN